MFPSLRIVALAGACVCLTAAPAGAQSPETPEEQGRFQFGPVRLTPWIAISDVGLDSNVFNESADEKRDFTTAVGPASLFWIDVGRSLVTLKSSGQYLFFNRYENQRSWATSNEGRWEVPLAHLTPFVTGTFATTRQRPSYEIDSRARQRVRGYGAGLELRAGGATTFVLAGRRTTTEFADDDPIFGAALAETLNRQTDTEEVQYRNDLTPLTTLVLKAEAIQDRFEHSPVRDAESIRVTGGFELNPLALISGSGFVGVRRFNPNNRTVPDYVGLVAAVKARYTFFATAIEVRLARDLDYSFEADQPYYALTDFGFTVTEPVSAKWDLVGRAGWQSLAYRDLDGDETNRRVDHGAIYGGGVGYFVGETLRLGFDVNYYRRDTRSITQQDYSGLRLGASVTYGMPQ